MATIDEALSNLTYTAKLIGLKQKMGMDYLNHDRYLSYLQENIEDTATHELIDKYFAKVGEDFFAVYGK